MNNYQIGLKKLGLTAAAVALCVSISACGGNAAKIDSTTNIAANATAESYGQTETYTDVVNVTEVVTDKQGHTSYSVIGTSVVNKVKTVAATKAQGANAAVKTTAKSGTANKTNANAATVKPESTTAPVTFSGEAKLNGKTATVLGSGISTSGNRVTISKAGTYKFGGSFSGQIIVNAPKTDKVEIYLNNVSITNISGPAVFCDSSSTTVISTLKGTTNTISDGTAYANDENNACIYADDDITFNGEGVLTVTGKYKNGIYSKNDVKVTSGTLNVSGITNGIKCKDKCFLKGGTVSVTGGNDGVKVTNVTESAKGFIEMTGGAVTIKAGDDAMQAKFHITVSGGKLNVKSSKNDFNTDKKQIDTNCLVK